MRIVINVKYRGGKVELETKKQGSAKDKVVEMNVGQTLYDFLNEAIQKVSGDLNAK